MEEVLRAAGTKSAAKYNGLRQATVAQWVVLIPHLEVCARETGYKGRGQKQMSRWRQQTNNETLWNTLEEAAQGDRS